MNYSEPNSKNCLDLDFVMKLIKKLIKLKTMIIKIENSKDKKHPRVPIPQTNSTYLLFQLINCSKVMTPILLNYRFNKIIKKILIKLI